MLKLAGDVINGAILDMDGVLWRSNTPLCILPNLFNQFKDHHLQVVLATNNGTHTSKEYIDKLDSFGVCLEDWQIVTSSMAVAFLVKNRYPDGGPVFIMGSAALASCLSDYGFFHSNESPQAVVAGLNWKVDYEMIKATSLMIQKGLPFFFTNPDPTYPTPEGNVPGAGTILAALETASGVKAMIAGKPQPYLFQVAMRKLSTKPENTIVIGDRLSTDILGGQNAGCKTVFVLSGVNDMKDLDILKLKPDLILDNIDNLFQQY